VHVVCVSQAKFHYAVQLATSSRAGLRPYYAVQLATRMTRMGYFMD